MSTSTTWFRLVRNLALVLIALLVAISTEMARGAPAPKPKLKVYALLYIPKKPNQYETIQNRRRQIASIKSQYTLCAAIRSFKGAGPSLLPEKGKGHGVEDNHDEDLTWMEQHVQIEYLDGTGVVRIGLDVGNPREQALLVNAVVHGYFKADVDRLKRRVEGNLESLRELVKALQEQVDASTGGKKRRFEEDIVEAKRLLRTHEEELRTLPRVVELADVPPE